MMMMMMREANRTRDAMIELSPPQNRQTRTHEEYPRSSSSNSRKGHTR